MSDFVFDDGDDYDLLSNLMGITGLDKEGAKLWLQIGNMDVETAIDLYLSSQSSITVPSFVGDEVDKIDNKDFVRSPDKVKLQTLLHYREDPLDRQKKYAAKKYTATFASGSTGKLTSSFENEEGLANLYKAPVEIIAIGDLDSVRTMATSRDKWLLVNIQCDSVFPCHLLNRDFWSDEGVKDMVQCSFIFWQQLDVSKEGEKFITRYKISEYPHVSIVDPRTGAIVWKHVGQFKAKLLAEKIQDFIGSFPSPSDFRTAKIPRFSSSYSSLPTPAATTTTTVAAVDVAKNAPAIGGSDNKDIVNLTDDPDGDDMDAELQEALKLSQTVDKPDLTVKAEGVASPLTSYHSCVFSELVGFGISQSLLPSDQQGVDPVVSPPSSSSSSSSSSLSSEGVVKASFMLPHSKRITAEFLTSTPVTHLLDFVSKQLLGSGNVSESRRFEINFSFPRKSLRDVIVEYHQGSSSSSSNEVATLSSIGITGGTAFFVTLVG